MTSDRKQAVRAAFAKAAATYDAESDVQRQVAEELAARLPRAASRVLEIGCGSGGYTRRLAARFPQAGIEAVDFCPQMLEQARSRCAELSNVTWVLADGEALPLEPATYDLITSSSALQWFSDAGTAIPHFARSLKPGGELAFSVFGPQAFAELNHVLAAEGLRPAAAGFAGADLWRGVMEASFTSVHIETLKVLRTYPTLAALLRKLQLTGANGGVWRGLLTPARLRAWEARYRAACGEIIATYEILFICGRA